MNTKPFEEALGNAEKQAAQSAGKMNKSLSNVGNLDNTVICVGVKITKHIMAAMEISAISSGEASAMAR